MSESILKKSRQYYRCVGSLYENGLKREDCKCKVRDEQGNSAGEKNGERIFGSIAVRTDTGIHEFNAYFQSLDIKGEPSKQWKMAEAMLEWNPEVNGDGSPATLVNVEGTVEINDYANPNKNNEISSGLRWRVGRANTKASPDDTKGCTLNATCFIHSTKPEIVKEEETGRLIVNLLGANNKGQCLPITAIVTEDMADDFEGIYEAGMTVNFDLNRITRHIGETAQPKKKAFGKAGDVAVNSGFDVTELIISGADDPIEEPEELTVEDENGNKVEVKTDWINPATMKKAIKERAKMLEEMQANGGKSKSSGGNDFKAKKAEAKSRLSKPKSVVEDDMEDDEDLLF